jgi:hypothetical protein
MSREELFLKVAHALIEAGVEQKIVLLPTDEVDYNKGYVEVEVDEVGWLYDFNDLPDDYEMWFEKAPPTDATEDWIIVELFKYAVRDYAQGIVESLLALSAYQKTYVDGRDVFADYGFTDVDPVVLTDVVVRNIEAKILKGGQWHVD